MAGRPTEGKFQHFRCESGVVTDVDRKTWRVKVETTYTSKTVPNVQIAPMYLHYANGEGIYFMPEVGARVLLGFPSDGTYPFIMCYTGAPNMSASETGAEDTAEDFSFRSRRPQMNPGDFGLTTRDENFLFLRRGGVVQIGATPTAQTVYIPINNFIKQFCENYDLNTLGGAFEWHVERAENDPGGNAPVTVVAHIKKFAQDAKSTVRVRMLPKGLQSQQAADSVVWDIAIAPQGIDEETGELSGEVYTMAIKADGSQIEFLGGNRHVTVQGDYRFEVKGSSTTKVTGDMSFEAQGNGLVKAGGTMSVHGRTVELIQGAAHPVPLGDKLVQILASGQWVVSGTVATMSPATTAALAQALSRKVFTQ